MYQVITEIRINGNRDMDRVFNKIYKRKKAAERNAKDGCYTTTTVDGKTMEVKTYVRGLLRPVSEQEAKMAYCKGKNIWVDCKYGQTKLTPSGWYSSHAPATELFYREVNHSQGYYCEYDGNYYIEDED